MCDKLCCSEADSLVLCVQKAKSRGENVGCKTAAGRFMEGRGFFFGLCCEYGLVYLESAHTCFETTRGIHTLL